MAGRFSIEGAFRALDAFSAPVAKMQSRLQAFTRAANAPMKQLNAVTDKVSGGLKTAAIAAAGLGVTGGIALVGLGKAGADFDQAMANVAAVSLMTRDQVADLEGAAKQLGSTTKFSATEVAGAMEMMGKAGFSNAEILQTIPGVLNAAAAEGMELADAASLVSNTLKGMGLAADQTTRVADVLTLASARTNSSISSLGEAMANVSSTAHQLGVPLEDTVASVALLQDVGLDASTAGTAVATMLTKLATPSKEAAGMMKELGISFKDTKGNMLPFGKVIAQFGKASEKSGGNMKTLAFFSELTGLRGQKAALALAEMGKQGKLADLTEELTHASGSAEKMANLRMNSFTGDVTRLGSAFDALKIAIFDTQNGALRGLVQQTTAWVSANKELIASKAAEYIQKIKDNLPEIKKQLERIAIGIAVFYAFAAAVKVAEGALVLLELATKAVGAATVIYSKVIESQTTATVAGTVATGARSAAQWIANTAINIGTLGTTKFTASTVASTVAAWASSAATWARNAAVGAFNVVMGLANTLITAYRNGTLIATGLEYAQAAATWIKNAAVTASNAVLAIAAVAHGEFATSAIGAAAANGSLIASFAPFLVTVAAATAAVGALIVLWKQWKAMSAETEGLGPAGVVSEMVKQGTFDPFKAVDTFQNQQARARAASRPEMVSPQDRVASTMSETNTTSTGEVTVRAEKGSSAAVTKAPKGFGLTVQPSGAF